MHGVEGQLAAQPGVGPFQRPCSSWIRVEEGNGRVGRASRRSRGQDGADDLAQVEVDRAKSATRQAVSRVFERLSAVERVALAINAIDDGLRRLRITGEDRPSFAA